MKGIVILAFLVLSLSSCGSGHPADVRPKQMLCAKGPYIFHLHGVSCPAARIVSRNVGRQSGQTAVTISIRGEDRHGVRGAWLCNSSRKAAVVHCRQGGHGFTRVLSSGRANE